MERGYVGSRGQKLDMDKDLEYVFELVKASYMTGLINGAKKFGVFRGGKRVVGVFEKNFDEFVKEVEGDFGLEYKDSLKMQMEIQDIQGKNVD